MLTQTIEIDYDDKRGVFLIQCPSFDKRASLAPEATKYSGSGWILTATPENMRYINEQYDRKYLTAPAMTRILQERATQPKAEGFPSWFEFKNPPMDKQWDALNDTYDDNHHALFMEMGTGKTFVTINVGSARAMNGDINAMIVICPTSVKPVWEIEFEKHCPIDTCIHTIESGQGPAVEKFIESDCDGMKVLIVGVESLSQGMAYGLAERFVIAHRCMAVLDESSRIKNPKAMRTKKSHILGTGCTYSTILTGTAVTQGMEDLYSQYRFLDWKIIGQKSFYTFKYRYCQMGGFEGRQIIGYINNDELLDLVAPHTTVILKEEMMDLPPKVYEMLSIQPSPAQKKALKELGDPFQMSTTIDDKLLEVETVLERMTRYQQIVGGHFPWKDDEMEQQIMRLPGKNPKMEEMLEQIDGLHPDSKVIIWARFIPEIEWIVEELRHRGHRAVTYMGSTPKEDRKQILIDFQEEGGPRFFVSNPSMGGIGITLTAANYTFYYSNTFSLEDRLQSEDRNHRKGQERNVLYTDLVMNHQIDKAMVSALRNKKEIADYVTNELQER